MDTLLLTLRRSAMSDINTIDKFIIDGMDILTTRPQTVRYFVFYLGGCDFYLVYCGEDKVT